MSAISSQAAIALVVLAVGCSDASRESTAGNANVGIDSLNARIIQAYRDHDTQKYGALYTDSAVFEWPEFNTVIGRFAVEAMAKENWAYLKDMDLKLIVANRRIDGAHATEFGAFEQTVTDAKGARMTEFGRYVTVVVRGADGVWRIDRFFGFEDSTRARSAPR